MITVKADQDRTSGKLMGLSFHLMYNLPLGQGSMSRRWSFLHTYVEYLVLLARFLVILLAYTCFLTT
jgi:hypothetical protein